MKTSKMTFIYKSRFNNVTFTGGKEKTLKYASKTLSDKVNFCNKCQLEKINNPAEGCYVCINCGECEFCCFFRG